MRNRITRWTRAALGSMASILTLACGAGSPTDEDPGDDSNGGGGGGNTPLVAQANVSMLTSDDVYSTATNTFSPSGVNLSINGIVTWTNATGILHNVTFSSPSAPAHVTSMGNGTASRTFDAAGTYSYQCTNHAGMSGTVTVTP